jgi:anti-anti-sigma factor
MPRKKVLVDSFVNRPDVLPPAFQCSWTSGALEAAWVHVEGELDIATAPQLEQVLCEPELQVRLVVLDLRGVAFMDSSGVHAIVDASIRARQADHRLFLLRGSPGVDRVFTLTGSADDVLNDIHGVEPSFQALMELVAEGVAP